MEHIEHGTALAGLPRLCIGCEQLGGVDWGEVDSHELLEAMRLAVRCKASFFDTAGIYGLGMSERRLHEALGSDRHSQFIATKGGLVAQAAAAENRAQVVKDASRLSLQQNVDESRQRLGLECLPLFYIHWPDATTPVQESFEALQALKQSGKISHAGLSNFSLKDLRAAEGIVSISAVQIPGSYLSPPDVEILDYCQSKGISVCVYGALAQGLLTGKYSSESKFDDSDRRHRLQHFSPKAWAENEARLGLFLDVAKDLDRPPAQVAIRYLLQTPGVSSVVVGVKSRVQLRGCLDALGWQLAEAELDKLRQP